MVTEDPVATFRREKMLSGIGQSYFVGIYMCSWLKYVVSFEHCVIP